MKIANLEHVESFSASGVVGGFGSRSYNFDRNSRLSIDLNERVDIKKRLDTISVVKGNSAIGEGTAEAYGPDSNAEAFSFTYTDPNSSAANATSISQS
jgi:hypothetical protein